MPFQVIYPDTLLKFNVSSAPSINVAVNASSVIIANAGNISSHMYANEISVDNTTNNTKSIMDDESVYCEDTDTGTSTRIYQQGKLLINETLPVNSFMNASGISFVNVSSTARLGTVDGVTLSTGSFKPTSILDGSNASGTSGQVLSAGAGGELSWVTSTSGFVGTADSNLSMSSYNVNFDDGTGKISTMNSSGISFIVSGTTARLSSTTGMYLDSDRTFVVSDGAGASNSVNASNSVISDGSKTIYLETTSIAFSGTAPMSPVVSIGSTDGMTITSGPFQPTSILDGSNASGTSGQVLSAGAGGTLSWITPASGADPTSDLNMSVYNLSWNGGLKLTDDGSGNLKINTVLNASNRTFAQTYLPINVLVSGTPTLAYLQIFI